MNIDFTIKKYKELIRMISHYYHVYNVLEYFKAVKNNDLKERYCIIRHDVDRYINNAFRIAKIDAENNISSTFYFRKNAFFSHPDLIKKIVSLRHEIGYHYEVLSDAKGNFSLAKDLFKVNLNKIDTICDVKTISMHGRPFSKFDNRDFWKVYSLEDFGLIGEAYLSIDYSDKYYFSDTGINWDNALFNIRDTVNSKGSLNIRHTDDLIYHIKKQNINRSVFLLHVDNWFKNIPLLVAHKLPISLINKIKSIKKKYNV